MSDQQRKPGAPDDTEGRRRLRAVSYPDPYLVTKLPLEGTVNSGVIRLGERMLLGFIHRPFPDGTRVKVVYDEWLFAERIDDGEGGEPVKKGPGSSRAKGGSSKSGAGRKKNSGGGRSKRSTGSGEAPSGAQTGEKSVSSADGKGESQQPESGRSAEAAEREEAAPTTPEPPAGGNRFPDDFSDPDRRGSDELGRQSDAWTDAFGGDERDD